MQNGGANDAPLRLAVKRAAPAPSPKYGNVVKSEGLGTLYISAAINRTLPAIADERRDSAITGRTGAAADGVDVESIRPRRPDQPLHSRRGWSWILSGEDVANTMASTSDAGKSAQRRQSVAAAAPRSDVHANHRRFVSYEPGLLRNHVSGGFGNCVISSLRTTRSGRYLPVAIRDAIGRHIAALSTGRHFGRTRVVVAPVRAEPAARASERRSMVAATLSRRARRRVYEVTLSASRRVGSAMSIRNCVLSDWRQTCSRQSITSHAPWLSARGRSQLGCPLQRPISPDGQESQFPSRASRGRDRNVGVCNNARQIWGRAFQGKPRVGCDKIRERRTVWIVVSNHDSGLGALRQLIGELRITSAVWFWRSAPP